MEKDILAVIESSMDSFSKGQKNIARYILKNYEKAAYMTAYRMGKTVNVSESTVVRFATRIGYEGYPEMLDALKDVIRRRLTSVQRMEVARDTLGNKEVISSVMTADIAKIHASLEELDRASFDKAVDAVLAAKKIYILGMRSSKALADFMGYYFRMLFDQVNVITAGSGSEIFERMMRITKDDVMIGISFPRYAANTVDAINYAKSKGAITISITDSDASPISDAAINLFVKSDMVSFVDSLVAPMSLINALIAAIASENGDKLSENFKNLESIWEECNVFEKARK